MTNFLIVYTLNKGLQRATWSVPVSQLSDCRQHLKALQCTHRTILGATYLISYSSLKCTSYSINMPFFYRHGIAIPYLNQLA